MNIIGTISGSSLDGLDMAICQFDNTTEDTLQWSVIKTCTVEFPKELRDKLSLAASCTSRELYPIEVEFSQFCVDAINEFVTHIEEKIDLVASHGHTVFHYPQYGYTLQIGKGSILAEGTGYRTACDFRSNDIALGGEGAPVAPIVEQYLYPGYDLYFNLGGIANVSLHGKDIVSIDSCPCNQVLNFLVHKMNLPYDDKGGIARTGVVHQELLESWGSLKYFDQSGPKSMDNSWVHEVFIPVMIKFNLSIPDGLATMIEFCAIQLTRDITLLGGEDMPKITTGFVTGGGALNDFLIERMSSHFKNLGLTLHLPDLKTINFKEAILMSLMGYLRFQELPNTIPSVTGATKQTIGGAIYLPSI